jgi:hypothetical protein
VPVTAPPPSGDAAATTTTTTTTITVVVDAATGGVLTTPDAAVTIEVPAGQTDNLTLSLTEVSPLTGDTNNLQVGGRRYLLTVQDSDGGSVTNFSPPLVLTFRPDPTLLASGNLDALLVFATNPDTGSFEALATTVAADRLLTTSVAALGSAPELGAPPGPSAGTEDAHIDWNTGSGDPVAD